MSADAGYRHSADPDGASVALSNDERAEVPAAIEAFYKAFDEGFIGPADYATKDWNHINPYGGRDRGREATLKRYAKCTNRF
jgi:hypothetical protein